jgi:hypothetical protein
MDRSVEGSSFEEIEIPVPFGFISGVYENHILYYIKYFKL